MWQKILSLLVLLWLSPTSNALLDNCTDSEVQRRLIIYKKFEDAYVVDGKIEVRYHPLQGFHTVAKRLINGQTEDRDEAITIKAPYSMVLCSNDDFPFKEEISEVLNRISEQISGKDYHDHIKSSRLLGIRIYLERHFNKQKYEELFEDDAPELFRERSELNYLFLYSFPNQTEDIENWPKKEYEYFKTIGYSAPDDQKESSSYAHGVFGNPITLFGFRHCKIDFE